MCKKIKKLGYGIVIHFNEYRKVFEVYKLGTYSPGGNIGTNTKISVHKNLKKAVKRYSKLYLSR